MTVEDALDELAHDHEDINRLVLGIGARLSSDEPVASRARLDDLREQLFLHFAREEEGLFPFVVDHFPDLADRVREMETAHDAICGAVARMCHLLAAGQNPIQLKPLFERFELAYAGHAKVEAELLQSLRKRVDADQRLVLAELIRSL